MLAAPLCSFAQPQDKVWRVGFLALDSGPNELAEAFRERPRTPGYIEGRNLAIEYRWGDGKDERLPTAARSNFRWYDRFAPIGDTCNIEPRCLGSGLELTC